MKASTKKLGQEIQLFLLKNGYQVDDLARQLGITAEGLSNLIHGRRRFKDDTLERLAETEIFRSGNFPLHRLKALRAMDEYGMDELVLAVLECVKRGEVEALPADFFGQISEALRQPNQPNAGPGPSLALLQSGEAARP